MAEQNQNPKEGCCTATKTMGTLFKVILGLVFLGLGMRAIWVWRVELIALIKGCIGLFLILAGIITLAIAKD